MTIIAVGFEGPNRVGKGTQIKLLTSHLVNFGAVTLSIKGDGSRPASGKKGDPRSQWWSDINKTIHHSASPELWDKAACRLSREFLIWRNRWLPKTMELEGAKVGYLLIDRTILSRCAFSLENAKDEIDNLYAADHRLVKRGIGYLTLCPDVIIRLTAPKKHLLKRLDKSDPKYSFRRALIERPVDWYERAHKTFPTNIRERIITIESIAAPDAVFERVVIALKERFPNSF